MDKNLITHTDAAAQASKEKFPLEIQIPALLFSYVFHPLFIPIIATWYLAFIHQGYFTGMSPHDKLFIILSVVVNTIILPGATVLLLKAVGFSKSIFIKTQRERIFVYVAANFFYFWMYLVFRNKTEIPLILTAFMFGIFLSSAVGLFVNIYFKISMHGLGMGALTGLLLIIIFSGSQYGIFLSALITFLLTGLVSTSRLIVGDHRPFDIYSGILFGIICQVISAAFIGLST
jgi:hypothetical protein